MPMSLERNDYKIFFKAIRFEVFDMKSMTQQILTLLLHTSPVVWCCLMKDCTSVQIDR